MKQRRPEKLFPCVLLIFIRKRPGAIRIIILLGVFLALRACAVQPPTYTFAPSGKDGGGCMVSVAPDPFTPGRVICGGDSWPFHITTNYGQLMTPICVRDPSDTDGLFDSANDMGASATRFSRKTTNLVYAATGEIVGGGGFLVSTNAGSTWVRVSTPAKFVGDNDAAPLVTQGHPRSVGNMIALDPTSEASEIIYVGTYSNGVIRSSNGGTSWTTIAIPGLTPAYTRGLAMDDLNPAIVYVACYDASNGNDSVYVISNAPSASSAILVSQPPFPKAEELVVVNGILYVATNTNGVYEYNPTNQVWARLYYDSAPSQFYSIDGFWNTNTDQAVIFAGTTTVALSEPNGLQFSLIRSTNSGAAWVCLTTNTAEIHTNMVMGDPGGDIWWLTAPTSDGVTDCIGGPQYVACQTALDPTDPTHNTIYVCGHGGLWRSDNALMTNSPTWYPCMRHLQASGSAAVAADPNVSTLAECSDVDWTFQYSTNNFANVIQKSTTIGGTENGYCLAVDSTTTPGPGNVSPVYFGRDTDLAYLADPMTTNWISSGLGDQGSVYGCSVKYISGIGTVVLAAVETNGIWRKIGGGNTGSWGGAPIYTADSIMQNTSSAQRGVFSWGGGSSQMVYFTDRVNGVFRSTNAGAAWSLIIGPGSPGGAGSGGSLIRSGSVAVDPTTDSVCYVTQTTGLYTSTNANAASPVFNPVTLPGVTGSVTPGWVVCDDVGNVYVNTLIDAQNQPKLFFKAKGDTVWYELSQGDPVFESLCGQTLQMAVGPGPAHVIYLSALGMCVATQNYLVPTVQATLAGTNFILSGTGNASTPYSVFTSTSLDLPVSNWSLAATQAFDHYGNYSWTSGLTSNVPAQFYRLAVP
ncbi:MAG TPA: hypothetical protein VMF08_12795 [Candidatus Sulfotelmatobacter sp.]|nr:hypothetical protein [Candidatus Sulfotelmatobacter sp.]